MNIAKISKSNGKSAVDSSAYIHREKFRADETGLLYDWRSKAKEEALVFSEVLLPENAPKEFSNPEILWNSVEKVEKASNSLFARRIIVALPEELSLEENKELLKTYCQKTFVDEGMCCDLAIHWKDGNPHAHLLLTTRPLKENGEWGAKEKKVYKLDENGERIPIIDPKTGEQKVDKRNRKQWERETVEVFSVNHRNMAEEWRSSWAEECNRYLSDSQKIDHRSFKRQGKEIQPQIHVGYSPRRAQINEEIKESQKVMKSLTEELKSLTEEIKASVDRILSVPRRWCREIEDRFEGGTFLSITLPKNIFIKIPKEKQRDEADFMRDIGEGTIHSREWDDSQEGMISIPLKEKVRVIHDFKHEDYPSEDLKKAVETHLVIKEQEKARTKERSASIKPKEKDLGDEI